MMIMIIIMIIIIIMIFMTRIKAVVSVRRPWTVQQNCSVSSKSLTLMAMAWCSQRTGTTAYIIIISIIVIQLWCGAARGSSPAPALDIPLTPQSSPSPSTPLLLGVVTVYCFLPLHRMRCSLCIAVVLGLMTAAGLVLLFPVLYLYRCPHVP